MSPSPSPRTCPTVSAMNRTLAQLSDREALRASGERGEADAVQSSEAMCDPREGADDPGRVPDRQSRGDPGGGSALTTLRGHAPYRPRRPRIAFGLQLKPRGMRNRIGGA